MKNEHKRVVLAYGEVTGHAHAFYGEDTVELIGDDLKIKKQDDLKHEEHTKHTLFPGEGKVEIQREYQQRRLRRVTD